MGYFQISLLTRHRARRIDLGVINGKIFASSIIQKLRLETLWWLSVLLPSVI